MAGVKPLNLGGAGAGEKKEEEGGDLLARLSAPSTSSDKPFSFAPSTSTTSAPATGDKPAFSFGDPPTSSTSSSLKPSTSSSLSADFFSKPSPAPSSSAEKKDSNDAPAATKPNFFGSIIASKASDSAPSPPPAPKPSTPTFGFSAPASAPVPAKEAPAPAAAANPFAAFGKPVSEILKDGGAGEKKAEESVGEKPGFGGFGGFGAKSEEVRCLRFSFLRC